MWNQFDIVQIIDTKRVKFLSGPKGRAALPNGNWSIVAFSGINAIISKQNTIVMIPIADIRKVAAYDINQIFKSEQKNIDMIDVVSKEFDADKEKAKQLLKTYNLPTLVSSKSEQEMVLKLLKERYDA